MKFTLPLLLTFVVMNANLHAQTIKDFDEGWEKFHISNIAPSNARHADLKKYLDELKKIDLKVSEVGRSYGSREIYQIEWGKGATKIFLWSQMHGDEPTATSALIDMFVFLQKNRDVAWVKKMAETLTIRAVPMLNPDGSELYQRRNLQDIDINRDAQNLATPEAQLLKKLRDEWNPAIGFNLHNQQSLTTVSGTSNQAAISFLVVEGDPINRDNEGNQRNKRLVSAMVAALQNYIRGNIGRYVDSYNPTAFGDKFSDWGTNVILIETGELYGKDEMFLVKMNFIAFLSALYALTDGSEKTFSPINYELLSNNGAGNLCNFVFRRASVVNRFNPEIITTADISINVERRRAAFFAPTTVREIGNSIVCRGLEEYDASAFNLFPRFDNLRVGGSGELLFYKKSRLVDWKAINIEKDFPPDAIFSQGKWVKGGELFVKK